MQISKSSIFSKVNKVAHQVRQYFASWGEALKAGWMITKLFLGRAVNLTFVKGSGEVREARAIAIGSLETLKNGFFRFVEQLGEGTQWRSCKLERIIL